MVFIKMPTTIQDSLFLRLFDPDCGGTNDQKMGEWNSATSFTLFGGQGAYTDELKASLNPSQDYINAGTVLKKTVYSLNPVTDNEWVTFGGFKAAMGFVEGDFVIFKLLVKGDDGDDGNAFDLLVSSSAIANSPVKGVEMFSFNPTIRIDKKLNDPEIRFITENSLKIEAGNYDVAGAPVSVETPVRSKLPVNSASDGSWSNSTIELNPFELNGTCALVIGKGAESPNDVTVYVKNSGSNLLRIQLPVKPYIPNNRPELKKQFDILADCYSVVFDASASRDRDNNVLSYTWNFGDGEQGNGIRVTHSYKEKKSFSASLLVTDNSGAVGNGSAEVFQVPVNLEPVSVIDVKKILAPGEKTLYSGKRSSDADGKVIKYVWSFGDGITAEGMEVEHAYVNPGDYTVGLQVTDNSLSPCNNNAVSTSIHVNTKPVVDAGKDVWIAPGQSYTFDASGSRTLIITDDAGVANSSATDQMVTMVNIAPIAKAGSSRIVAPGETVYFDGKQSSDADGGITKYTWSFGDGSNSTGINVSHVYDKPGTYKVQLLVEDNSETGTRSAKDEITITVNKQPTVTIGDDKLLTTSTVQFSGDAAKDEDGSITQYMWDFGDGIKSTDKSPLHTYQKPGLYKVVLKVKDNTETVNNGAEASMHVTINAKPIADAGKNQVGAPGQDLFFTAKESFDPDGVVGEYIWDFGDGTTMKSKDAFHSFKKPGLYKVRLKVADNTAQEDAIDFTEINVVINASPNAISGTDIICLPNQKITVDGTKSFDPDGAIGSYKWEFFPKGGLFHTATVTKDFTEPGVYYAILTVTDNSGAINATAKDTIRIKVNSQPVANAGVNVYTCNTKIVFDGSKSSDADGDPLTYTWEYGDQSPTETGVQVVHTYKKGGTFPVILKIDDGMGLANSVSTTAIKVTINEPPVANGGSDQIVCAGEVVRFNASESKDPEGGALKYTWDLGDGTIAEGVNPTKIYKIGGSYQIKLTVQDDSGLPCNTDYDSKVVVVSESPVANAGPDISACANAVIQFDGSKSHDYDGVVNSFTWDFGDGAVGGGALPTHSFAKAGIYRVTLSITGDVKGDCNNSDSDELIVSVIDAPKSDFDVPQNFPVGKSLNLTANPTVSSGVQVTGYFWDFGDGTKDSGRVVQKVYNKFGQYFISLLIKTDAKTDCFEASVKKLIILNEKPAARISSAKIIGPNQPLDLDASKSSDADGPVQYFDWNFGDGSTGKGVIQKHRYQKPGLYKVELQVKDNTTLENNISFDTVTIRVNAEPIPVGKYPAASAPGEKIDFSASESNDPDGTIKEYQWDFGDGQTASGMNVTHVYALPGMYNVTLAVDDGDNLGNSRTEQVRKIQINNKPEVIIGKQIDVCASEMFTIVPKKVFDADRDSLTYTWKADDGAVYSAKELKHAFKTTGLHKVTLTVNDNKSTSVSQATDEVIVYVNNSPVPSTGGNRNGFTGGAHDELLFDGSLTTDADTDPLQFSWDFGDGFKANGEKVYHLFEKEGEYIVTLTVNDGRGTACSIAKQTCKITISLRK
ncbi:MAG: PKD domain-containing protein [Ignavibacteriales bacterium]|nr:PKD domain-containing protein [Ignavibacteriales bacterium]